MRERGQVLLQDDVVLPENFMGAAIAQDEIGRDSIMEVRVAKSWRDIQEQHIAEK